MESEAQIFKALGEPIRLRLAVLLSCESEVCVCRLADALNEPQFKISRHLAILRNAGLVASRREGKWMYYRLTEPDSPLMQCMRHCLSRCLDTHATARADMDRLKNSCC